MTNKITLASVSTVDPSIVTTINNNNALITTAINNTLSRDGTSPNTMAADLDLNGYHILNLPAPAGNTSPVRQADLTTNSVLSFGQTSTKIGLTPVAGTASTAMHSDSVLAIDQSIAPTWTGAHTFSSGALTVGDSIQRLTSGGTTTLTMPASGTVVSTTDTQTLTNKTLTSPVTNTPTINSPTITGGALVSTTINNAIIGGTTPAAGSFTTVSGSTSILSSGSSGGVGYKTGAGTAVTQGTNKATGVTANTVTGQITTSGSTLSANGAIAFVITNSSIAVNDVILLNIQSGATSGGYTYHISNVSSGAATVQLKNMTSGLSDTIKFNYAIIKGVSS